jgi:hypothetical protein
MCFSRRFNDHVSRCSLSPLPIYRLHREQDGDSSVFYRRNTLRIYFLNIKEPFIYQLVAILADQMGEVFLKSENNKV